MAPSGFLTVALGLSAALFVGYCVYFDRKRRSNPEFRKRLRERRHRLGGAATTPTSSPTGPRAESKQSALESYFLREMRQGEDLIGQGRLDEGLSHFANAVALCAQPEKVIQALQNTLPTHMFDILIMKLKILHVVGSDTGTEDWSEGSSIQDA